MAQLKCFKNETKFLFTDTPITAAKKPLPEEEDFYPAATFEDHPDEITANNSIDNSGTDDNAEVEVEPVPKLSSRTSSLNHHTAVKATDEEISLRLGVLLDPRRITVRFLSQHLKVEEDDVSLKW